VRRSPILLATLLMAGTFLSLHAQSALATATTLTVSASSSPFEQPLTLTATVTDSNGTVMHGSVTFFDGTILLGTRTIVSTSSGGHTPGQAFLVTRSLSQTTHSLTAKFLPTAADQTSISVAQPVTITAAAGPYTSETMLVSTPGTSSGKFNLTATVGAYGPFAPTGTVAFEDTTTGSSLGTAGLSGNNPGLLLWESSIITPLDTTPPDSSITSANAAFAVAGDFNNDGNADLAIVGNDSFGNGFLATALGNGNGQFTTTLSNVSLTASDDLLGLAADFNDDGNLDILVTDSYTAGSAELFFGNGDGTYQAPVTVTLPGSGLLAVGDVNNDGIPDLIQVNVINAYSNQISINVLLGQGNGTFSPGFTSTLSLNQTPESLQSVVPTIVGDVNNDGYADIVVAAGTQLIVLLGKGNGSFQTPALYSDGDTTSQTCTYGGDCTTLGLFPASIALADLRRDGNIDVIVGSNTGGTSSDYVPQFSVLLGDETGTYPNVASVPLPSISLVGDLFYPTADFSVGDINFDGIPDLLFPSSENSQPNYLFLGKGDGTFSAAQAISGSASTTLADFTNTGDSEFAVFPVPPTYEATIPLDVERPGLEAAAPLPNTSVTATGTQEADATYGGDSNNAGSTSSSVPLLGGLAATMLVGTPPIDSDSSSYLLAGYGSTLIATIGPSASGPTPTGTVQFIIDGSASGSPVVLSAGSAAIPIEWSVPGSHFFQAIYSGDSNYRLETSELESLTVYSQAPTFMNISVPATVSAGSTLTAAIEIQRTAQGPVPTGSVTVTIGGQTTQETLNGTPATASYSLNTASPPIPVGPQSLSASYAGNSLWQASTSTASFVVTGTTALTISYSGSSTVASGSPVTITGQLIGNQTGVAPTGTVTLLDNGNAIGTATLSGSSPFSLNFTANTLSQPFPTGSNVLSLSYSGDTDWQASTSGNVTLNVGNGDAVTLTSNLLYTQAISETTIQFTAVVAPKGSTTTPTGAVQFYDGTTPIGSPVTLASGSASFSSSTFAVGSHSVTAAYSGNSTYPTQTSAPLTFQITANGTINMGFELPGSRAFQITSEEIVVFVQESPPEAGPAPTGTITLENNGTVVGTDPYPSSGTSGNVYFFPNATAAPFVVGTNTLTASYSGDSHWSADSISENYQLVQGTTSLTGGCKGTVVSGTSIDCGGQLSWSSPITPPAGPAGTFTVSANGNTVGTLSLPPMNVSATGSEQVSVPVNTASQPLAPGTYNMALSYLGGNGWLGSSVTSTLTVTGNVPTFTLTSNLGSYSSVVQGTPVTFTATAGATSGLGTPTGTVQFYVNGTPAGNPVTMTDGVATYTTSSLGTGQQTVGASYSGNSNYSPTTTNSVVAVVTQGPDVLGMTVSGPATVSLGTPVTVNGTVTVGALGPAPTGIVTLLDGTAPLATTNLNGSNPAAVAFTVNTSSQPLAPGAHTFSLKYAGSTQWAASASSSAVLSVTQAASTTTLTSSATTAKAGASVTFTAVVSSTVTSPAPTGTVQFYDGTTALGTPIPVENESVSYTTSALSGGTHSITAVYSGDANFATSTSAVFTETIQSISLASTVLTGTVNPGSSATYTLTVTATGSANESTSFACSTLPQGAACSLSPQTVTGSGSTTLTITTTGSSSATTPNLLKLWGERGVPVLACVVLLMAPARRRKQLLFLILLALVPALTVGCGGGGGGGCGANCTSGGTPAGTYTITVTSTTGSGASAITATTTVTLTVQ
jgi:hypothetical protein